MEKVVDLDANLVLVDEDGNEQLAEVLFTLENDGNNYVFVTIPEQNDDEEADVDIFVYRYGELEDGSVGNVFEIPEGDTETWELLEEVLETYNDTGFEVE